MQNVRKVFFLSESEAKEKREKLGDAFIDHLMPHYELEDGTIIWGKLGYPAAGERWWAEGKKS